VRRIVVILGVTLIVSALLGVIGTQLLSAQQELAKGTVLQRATLEGMKGKEAVLVLRELPPGAASGKHYQSGNEVAYVLEGSMSLEVEGKPAITLKPGDTFQTGPRQVHNVGNTSKTAPAKALVFYVVEKGKPLSDISTPAK
jgi:quercetin dioxygenase-like cupin family protein